jgi:hypothetical protein
MASKRDPRLALNGSRASVEPEVASSGVASGAARKRSSLAGQGCALCPLGHEAVPVLGPLLQFDLNRKKATVLVHQLCALWAPKAHHSTDVRRAGSCPCRACLLGGLLLLQGTACAACHSACFSARGASPSSTGSIPFRQHAVSLAPLHWQFLGLPLPAARRAEWFHECASRGPTGK